MTEPPVPPGPPSGDPSQWNPTGRPQPGPPQGGDPAQPYPGGYPAQPRYGQQPYPGGYAPGAEYGAPAPQRPPVTLATLLGSRAFRRPDVRAGVSLAGAGAALVVAGVFVWSIGYFIHGFHVSFDDESGSSSSGDGRRFFGFLLFLALTALGYAAVVLRRRGPVVTAGVVASAAGVPLALGFLFLNIGGAFAGGGDPINLDAVFLISIIVWLVTYVAVPGARGRSVYLAAAAVALPSYIAFKISGNAGFELGASVFGDGSSRGAGSDAGSVTALLLVFGLGYYGVALLLDRRGRAGVATAFLYPAFVATVGGLLASTDPFGQVGTGAALLVIGAAVAVYGGRHGRRFTSWVWSFGAVLGIAVMVAKIDTDKYWLIAILLIVLGGAVVLGAQALSGTLGETPDIEEPVG